jgi:hypothetical protein
MVTLGLQSADRIFPTGFDFLSMRQTMNRGVVSGRMESMFFIVVIVQYLVDDGEECARKLAGKSIKLPRHSFRFRAASPPFTDGAFPDSSTKLSTTPSPDSPRSLVSFVSLVEEGWTLTSIVQVPSERRMVLLQSLNLATLLLHTYSNAPAR